MYLSPAFDVSLSCHVGEISCLHPILSKGRLHSNKRQNTIYQKAGYNPNKRQNTSHPTQNRFFPASFLPLWRYILPASQSNKRQDTIHQKAGHNPIKGRTHLIQPKIDSILPLTRLPLSCLRCISFLPPIPSKGRNQPHPKAGRGTKRQAGGRKAPKGNLKPHTPIRLTYGTSMAHTLGWKWEVTHDGPIHQWSSIPSSASNTPASPPASDAPASPPASKDTPPTPVKTKLAAHWYVLHDGVVVPFYDP